MEGTATSPLLRRLNARLVLEALRGAGAMTVTDMVAATQLSRPTVHAVVDALARIGQVREVPDDETAGPRRGRPARRYEFRADASYVLGLDVGAGTMVVVVADLRGELVAQTRRHFPDLHMEADERIAFIRRTMVAALAEAGVDPADVMAVCVGAAGVVDPRDGAIRFSSGIHGFLEVNLREALERGFGWPVIVENDANLAAVGEQRRGVAAGADNFVVLLAGERLGSGIVLGGQLVRGHGGGAGEMGFLSLDGSGDNAWGIAYLARRLGAEAVARMSDPDAGNPPRPGSLYERVGGDPGGVDATAVFAAAQAGDEVAVGVLERVVDRVAKSVGTIALLLDPELVVIGGGVAAAGDVLLVPLRRRLVGVVPERLRIEASTLGDRGVVTGAVCRAVDEAWARLLDAWPSDDIAG
nr:ROK family transcriptional regulator [Planosporangium thailandense]